LLYHISGHDVDDCFQVPSRAAGVHLCVGGAGAAFCRGAEGAKRGAVPFFSIREELQRLEQTAGRLRTELATLPQIDDSLQLDAYGYHSGYLPALDELPEEPRWTVELSAGLKHSFNELYLIPAADRRAFYD